MFVWVSVHLQTHGTRPKIARRCKWAILTAALAHVDKPTRLDDKLIVHICLLDHCFSPAGDRTIWHASHLISCSLTQIPISHSVARREVYEVTVIAQFAGGVCLTWLIEGR